MDGDPLNAAADDAANAAAREDKVEVVDDTAPCPDCGASATGDAGLYACECDRIFESGACGRGSQRPGRTPRAPGHHPPNRLGTDGARGAVEQARDGKGP